MTETGDGLAAAAAKAVNELVDQGLRVAVAESCTGGLLGAAFTSIAGASKTFCGGLIVYDNDAKTEHLGVDPTLFADGHGAVSATVAEAMADGVRRRFHADVGIGVSGIAGPSGGTESKPVGTVWLACVGPADLVNVHRIQADGNRDDVRHAAVAEALRLLRRNLHESGQA